MNKKYIVLIFAMNLLVVSSYGKENDLKNDYLMQRFLTLEDFNIIIKTEKEIYSSGEPIILKVSICNLTDTIKEVVLSNIAMYNFKINIKKHPDKLGKRFIDENNLYFTDHNHYGSNMTGYCKNKRFFENIRPYYIAPKKSISMEILLNLWFDLSESIGDYEINVSFDAMKFGIPMVEEREIPKLIITKSTNFKIIENRIPSISSICVSEMINLFGDDKTLDYLCFEAEDAIMILKKQDISEFIQIKELNRLKKIVNTLEHFIHIKAREEQGDKMEIYGKMSNIIRHKQESIADDKETFQNIEQFIHDCRIKLQNSH